MIHSLDQEAGNRYQYREQKLTAIAKLYNCAFMNQLDLNLK